MLEYGRGHFVLRDKSPRKIRFVPFLTSIMETALVVSTMSKKSAHEGKSQL